MEFVIDTKLLACAGLVVGINASAVVAGFDEHSVEAYGLAAFEQFLDSRSEVAVCLLGESLSVNDGRGHAVDDIPPREGGGAVR